MNKFFKSIVTVVLSSIVLLSATAHAQDKFGIKEGSYIGELLNEDKGQVLARAYAQIVIEKDGTGFFRQDSFTGPCHKGELKLSQKRDKSDQLMFEVKPSGDKEKCHKLYYLVTKSQGYFTTHFVIVDTKGNYKRPHDESGRWIKN